MNNWITQIILLILCAKFGESIGYALNGSGSNITEKLNAIFEKGYDKRLRPGYGVEPVVVSVTMFINDISDISESQMDFTCEFYFRQSWFDNRLAFDSQSESTQLVVESELIDKLWTPDTFFVNEKKSSLHKTTKPNIFLRISSKGEVYTSIRITMTASCPMDLKYFPMDSQKCSIGIESYGYTIESVLYNWLNGSASVQVKKGLKLPQFRLIGHKLTSTTNALHTGTFSHIICQFLFKRSIGYYLIQAYIPAGLIVIISWIPFWLDRRDSHARVALGVTTVLTITTLITNTNESLPKISYIKSIDVFLEFCFLMVFGALIEYAFVGFMMKSVTKRKSETDLTHDLNPIEMIESENIVKPLTFVQNRNISSENESLPKKTSSKSCNKILTNRFSKPLTCDKVCGIRVNCVDKYSRKLFPICFVCFNFLYWICYLYMSSVSTNDFVLNQ